MLFARGLTHKKLIRIVLTCLFALIELLQVSSEVRAGKILSAAKWAAGEIVKQALAEYAAHEANESFDVFKQRFCSDKDYRTKVLSSPAISLLIKNQNSAESLVVDMLGCGYVLGKINIVFIAAEPNNFQNGQATTCVLKANIRNYSKYHLNKLTFQVGSWRFEVGDMVANSYEDDVVMSNIYLSGATCKSQGMYLLQNLKDAAALECSIPNMAEGDCQELTSFTTTLNADVLASLGSEEASVAEKDKQDRIRAAAQADAAKRAEITKFNLKGGETFTKWGTHPLPLVAYQSMSLTSPQVRYDGQIVIAIVSVHKGNDGGDDWYFAKLWNEGGLNASGWIEAANLREQRKTGTLRWCFTPPQEKFCYPTSDPILDAKR